MTKQTIYVCVECRSDFKEYKGMPLDSICKSCFEGMKPKSELKIYKEFYEKIKRMVRDSGKTNFLLISEVDEEIIKVGNELEKSK